MFHAAVTAHEIDEVGREGGGVESQTPSVSRVGEHVGQRNLAVTANTYSHVLSDETQLDYEELTR